MIFTENKATRWYDPLKDLLFKRGITLEEDPEVHRKIFKRAFIATFIYSLIYGMYEYFIVYHYPKFLDLYGGNPVINWGMMYTALILTVAIAPRFSWYKTLAITLSYSCAYILAAIFLQALILPIILVCVIITLLYIVSIEYTVMGLFFMTVFEDFMFFMSSWVDTGIYPYPACTIGVPESCWWNNSLASFAVLGNIGNPIPFWPYIPFYYIPGLALCALFYIASYIGAKPTRIVAWIIGPFFVAIIAGALGSHDLARIILIALPLISYTYIITIYALRNRINNIKTG